MTFVGSIANFATITSIPKKNFMAENDALQVNKQNMKGTHILRNDYFRDFPQFMGSLISSLQKLRHNLQM